MNALLVALALAAPVIGPVPSSGSGGSSDGGACFYIDPLHIFCPVSVAVDGGVTGITLTIRGDAGISGNLNVGGSATILGTLLAAGATFGVNAFGQVTMVAPANISNGLVGVDLSNNLTLIPQGGVGGGSQHVVAYGGLTIPDGGLFTPFVDAGQGVFQLLYSPLWQGNFTLGGVPGEYVLYLDDGGSAYIGETGSGNIYLSPNGGFSGQVQSNAPIVSGQSMISPAFCVTPDAGCFEGSYPASLVDGGVAWFTYAIINTLDAGNVVANGLVATPLVDAGIVVGTVFPAYDTGASTTLYVIQSSNGGNDSNACTALVSGCATIQGAVNKIPKLTEHAYTILVSDGGYSAGAYILGYQMGVGNYTPTSSMGPSISIVGAWGAANLGGAMNGSVTSATIGGAPAGYALNGSVSNWATVTVTGAGWSVNALQGHPFCIESGVGAGQCPLVYTNTATVATLIGAFPVTAPTSGSTYSIMQWQTSINGTLPRPPGGTPYGGGYSSVASGYPASFIISGNHAPGIQTAVGYEQVQGYFPAFPGDSGIFTDPGFTEPQISISGFQFNITDYSTAIAASGPDQLISVTGNANDAGMFTSFSGGSGLLAYANLTSNDIFGTPVYTQRGGSFLALGNMCTIPGSGGFTICLNVSGASPVSILQNYLTEQGTAQTETGFQYGGVGSVSLNGNEFSWLGTAWYDQSGTYEISELGDDFNHNGIAMSMAEGNSRMILSQNPTGDGNQTALSISRGALVYLNGLCPSLDGGYQVVINGYPGTDTFHWTDVDVCGAGQPLIDLSQGASVYP